MEAGAGSTAIPQVIDTEESDQADGFHCFDSQTISIEDVVVPGMASTAEAAPVNTLPAAHIFSTIAHELRTPLSSLMTSSELLANELDDLDAHEIRGMVSKIHRGALWLHGLVENLLCAATISQGRLQIHMRAQPMHEIVDEIVPIVEPVLARRGQRLQVYLRGTRRDAMADRRRIGQVLVNLITNASKFTDAGGAIDVVVEGRSDWLRVSVADRGPGIPEGSETLLFEPYARAAASVEAGKDGVGLGLAIVKSIVDAHGGRVGAGNRPGGGARFWFELQAAEAESEECPEPSLEPALAGSW
jgi:two-component system sensor histidine kinase KdpD